MNCFSLKNVLLYVECKSHSSTRNISSLGYLCMHTGASCPILYYYTIMQQCVTSKVCVGMFGWNSVKKWYSTILAWSSGLFSQINPFQVVYCIYYWHCIIGEIRSSFKFAHKHFRHFSDLLNVFNNFLSWID